MAKLKQTENKLLRAGYVREHDGSSHQVWIDATPSQGCNIAFWVQGEEVDGSFKVVGREPDRPEFDHFTSTYTSSVSQAIRLARI